MARPFSTLGKLAVQSVALGFNKTDAGTALLRDH
jgi:hypothetical protein